jgi:hypothetical protein
MATKQKKKPIKAAPKKPAPKPVQTISWQVRAKWLAKWIGIPLLFYFIFFSIYSWPWIYNFNTAFMTDGGDGLQNVWNIWWVNKSVTELNQLPWHTIFLHAPHGVTLLGQTLNPFNGFVSILLLNFMSLVQAFNTMVIFSFVIGGLTAFWLCYYFSKSYIPSLIGGFIFTFSSYHFAHAIGHMQLVSLEWIPLFILLWWKLLKRPRYSTAAGAAITLLLVLFCDYYYFLYSVLAAGLITLYFWRTKQLPPLKDKKTILPFGLFGAIAVVIVAPLPLALLRLNSHEVLSGSHPARELSTNILAPFIDGGFWRFSSLTDWYWNHVPSFIAESSVYLGISVLVIIVIALLRRKIIGKDVQFWILLGLFFGILSYGPRLMIGHNSIESVPLPYAFLEKIFPPLKLSGVPVRMMVMVTLSAAVITALVLARLKLSNVKSRVLLAIFFVFLFIEMFPGSLPMTPKTHLPYAQALKDLPAGIVFDGGTPTSPSALYSQTLHEKPMVLGYISRTPKSVEDKDWLIVASVLENRYKELCSTYKVRYYTVSAEKPATGITYPVVYSDKDVIVYDLKDSPNC